LFVPRTSSFFGGLSRCFRPGSTTHHDRFLASSWAPQLLIPPSFFTQPLPLSRVTPLLPPSLSERCPLQTFCSCHPLVASLFFRGTLDPRSPSPHGGQRQKPVFPKRFFVNFFLAPPSFDFLQRRRFFFLFFFFFLSPFLRVFFVWFFPVLLSPGNPLSTGSFFFSFFLVLVHEAFSPGPVGGAPLFFTSFFLNVLEPFSGPFPHLHLDALSLLLPFALPTPFPFFSVRVCGRPLPFSFFLDFLSL